MRTEEYKELSILNIIEYGIQIANGLSYIHIMNIFHGDMKPGKF